MSPETRTTTRSPVSWGCLFKAPLGCSAYVLGALAALVAMVPNLISELAARRLEDAFADAFYGRIEVARVDLAWLGRQRITSAQLYLDDARVASVEFLECPGLVELWRDGFTLADGLTNLGEITAKVEADLFLDDERGANLVQALTPREDSEFLRWFQRGEDLARTGSPSEGLQGWERYSGDIHLIVDRLRWHDSRTLRGGVPFELSGLDCRLNLESGVAARLEIGGGAPADIDIALAWEAPEVTGEPPSVTVDRWSIEEFPTRLAGRLVAQPAMLEELLGETIDLDFEAMEKSDGTYFVELDLRSRRASILADGVLDGDRLVIEEDAVECEFQWPTNYVEELLGPDLRALGLERQTVGSVDYNAVKLVVADQLVVPWRRLVDPRLTFAEQIEGIELSLDFGLGNWSLDTRTASGGVHTEKIAYLSLELRSTSQSGLVRSEITLRANFNKLDLSMELEDTAAFAALFEGEAYTGAPIEVLVRRLPPRSFEGVLPLPLGLDIVPTAEEPCRLTLHNAELLEGPGPLHDRFRGELRISLPSAGVHDPLTTFALAELLNVEVPVILRADGSIDIGLSGSLRDEGGGSGVPVSMRIDALLGRPERDGRALDLTFTADGFPTATADAWLGTGRLLTDVLGASFDVERFSVAGPAGGTPRLEFELASSLASVSGAGRLTGGALTAEGDDVVRLDYELTPDSVRALVVALVPVLADATSPERAALELGEYSLPLDGSLNLLTTEVALELPGAELELQPALEARLALVEDEAVRVPQDTVVLGIEDGRAEFRRLVLDLEGGRLNFEGGFDLKAGFLDLTSRIPLGLVGAGDGAVLDTLREQLEESVAVELAVVGNRERGLRVVVSASAIDGADASSLMMKGLEGLLKKE